MISIFPQMPNRNKLVISFVVLEYEKKYTKMTMINEQRNSQGETKVIRSRRLVRLSHRRNSGMMSRVLLYLLLHTYIIT